MCSGQRLCMAWPIIASYHKSFLAGNFVKKKNYNTCKGFAAARNEKKKIQKRETARRERTKGANQ